MFTSWWACSPVMTLGWRWMVRFYGLGLRGTARRATGTVRRFYYIRTSSSSSSRRRSSSSCSSSSCRCCCRSRGRCHGGFFGGWRRMKGGRWCFASFSHHHAHISSHICVVTVDAFLVTSFTSLLNVGRWCLVHTADADKTRQDSFVLSVSAVWNRHECSSDTWPWHLTPADSYRVLSWSNTEMQSCCLTAYYKSTIITFDVYLTALRLNQNAFYTYKVPKRKLCRPVV